jgi:protein SCO1/2
VALAAAPAAAGTRVARPDDVKIEEHLGAQVPLGLAFTDTSGGRVTLGELTREKPLLLVLAYERCPMLCGLVLHGAADAVRGLEGLRLGEDFRAVTISFDPEEDARAARQKQETLLSQIGSPGRTSLWPFLRGGEAEIAALTGSLGFYYYRDPVSGELAHPAVLVVLSPGGKVSRYLHGVAFTPRDLKLALVEASEGRSGSALDRVLLRCWRYDASTHRYEPAIQSLMRATGATLAVSVAGFLALLWRRERRRRR